MTTDQCSWCHHSLSTTVVEEPESRAAESETLETVSASTSLPEPELHADYEESPLVAGLTAPKDQPNAPPPVTALPANAAQETAARPVIGVRRSGTAGGGRSIPAVPPPRPSTGSRSGAHTPAPAMPLPQQRTTAPTPRPAVVPAANVNTATLPNAVVTPPVRPPEISASKTGRLAVPTALMGGAKAAVPETVSATPQPAAPSARVGQPIVEGEAGGLADGFSAPSRATENAQVPQLGTFTPAKSKYYSGQIVDPVSGTHYDADTGRAVTATSAETTPSNGKKDDIVLNWDKPEPTMAGTVAKFLGIFAIILIAGAVIAAIAPSGMIAPLIVANFAGGLLLPVLGVVPWQDEDSDDAILMFVLSLVFGPVVSLLIYGGLTVIRQNGNAAVVGILTVSALSNLVIRYAAGQLHSFSELMPFPTGGFSVTIMFLNWTGLLAIAGWFVANIFHKFDE